MCFSDLATYFAHLIFYRKSEAVEVVFECKKFYSLLVRRLVCCLFLFFWLFVVCCLLFVVCCLLLHIFFRSIHNP